MNKDCVGCGRTFHTESDEAGEDGLCAYCTAYEENEKLELVAHYATAEYWSDLKLACSQWKAVPLFE